MFKNAKNFSSFAVDDIKKAKEFYSQTLGVEVSDVEGMQGLIELNLVGGNKVMVYEKEDYAPATFTVLNFLVDDIDKAADELIKQGVQFEKYEGFGQDEKGIGRGKSAGKGPDIAWFKDPAGNILSILEK